MSRMDRFKHIHEDSQKSENKGSFNPRREKNGRKTEKQPVEQDYQDQETRLYSDSEDSGNIPGPGKPPKVKKPKKRRKIKLLRWLLIMLILLIVLPIVFFFKGKHAAENDTSIPQEEAEIFNGVTSSNGANNILILGSDTRGEDSGRADTIMVLQLDGPSGKLKLISFMRDTFVDIPGYETNKINAAYAYGGAELVRQTLAQNFGIDCKYYAKVDFQSFEKVIDSLFPGGVEIDSEKDLNLDGVDIAQGNQKMDGHVLLQYARFRMDEEGDFGRVRRQQQVMTAVISQLKSPLVLIRTPESAGKLIGYMANNIPMSFILKNGPSLALKGTAGIDRLTVPVDGSWWDEYYDYAGSVLATDNEMNQQAIQAFLAD
ncbi:LCP family protein [Enterococcus sp. BWT-B8]|uniref:LCP family protein n=1 Tax=Enterococcus sp. BWT-B8 TaxID=2885157 RepID=UPI001E64C4F2|nr:LCP family protein [Enterococcus sp. BWT-B8]MCB5950636.1 LCP family protein [Enterococcus sp. BWT-B8]